MGHATTLHRNYCNYVKKELLKYSVSILQGDQKTKLALLDMCCGRGGDMFKWGAVGIRKVYGIDSDLASIKEAIRRYAEYRKRVKNPITVHFFSESSLSSEYIRDTVLRGSKVSIVSCMFAIHYFYGDTLRVFLENVSTNLVSGGLFVGIAPDSFYIKKLLDPSDPFKNDEVMVRPGESDESYYFFLKDETNTDYFSFRGESFEYMVSQENLAKVASECSLELLQMRNISEWDPLTSSSVSGLYFSFLFRKK